MIGQITKLQCLRWLLVLFISLSWATIGSAAATAEHSCYGHCGIAANSGGRTIYTVQGEANAARLLSGGTPWPTAPAKAHLGEGLYTWGSRSQAEAYVSLLEGRGASGLRIMEASIPEAQYNALRAMDLRGLGDAAAPMRLVKRFRAGVRFRMGFA